MGIGVADRGRQLYRSPIPKRVEKILVGVFSAYELVAICTGKVPTLSNMIQRNRLLGAFIVGYAANHLITKAEHVGDS